METTMQILEKKHPYIQNMDAMMGFFSTIMKPTEEKKKGGNNGRR